MSDAGSWVLVEFTTDRENAEFLSADLWARGVAAVEEIDNPDGTVTLRTSLGSGTDAAVPGLLSAHPGTTVRPVEFPREVADTWRRYVSPTRVVGDVWLVPEWCERPPGTSIVVEPFDTFGLGNHPTTVLTLRSALGLCDAGTRVLDLGSGSGVLAVAVALVRGSRVDAFDIAPQAANALDHNARANGVRDLVDWQDPFDEPTARTYDVVMANILAPVLRSLAPGIIAVTRPGGHIVLSGLRADQVGSVTECFADCVQTMREDMDGWSAVTLRRNA